MKVLLAHRGPEGGEPASPASTLPVALPWLAAAVRQAGHAAVVVNFSRLGWRDVGAYLEAAGADVLVAHWLTQNRRSSQRLSRLMRRTRAGALIVAAGPFASAVPETLLHRVSEVDVVLSGSGETSLTRLLLEIAGSRRPRSSAAATVVPGVVTRTGGGAPEPAREPWALGSPLKGLEAAGLVPARDLRRVLALRPGPAGEVHLRPVADVVGDLRILRDRFGLLDASLVGGSLTARPAHLLELGAAVSAARLGLTWDIQSELADFPVGAAGPANLEADLVAALSTAASAGCRRVRFEVDLGGEDGTAALDRRAAEAAGRVLSQAAAPPHLLVRHGSAASAASEMETLRALVGTLRPREGEIVAREVTAGSAAWRRMAEDEGLVDPFWFDDERESILETSPRKVEAGATALGAILAKGTKGARLGTKDLERLERAWPQGAWPCLEWGDYRLALGDLEEAQARYERAAAAEPWSALPWLRLAALHARADGGLPGEELRALREVLSRVPQHEAARATIEAARSARSRHRGGRRKPRTPAR